MSRTRSILIPFALMLLTVPFAWADCPLTRSPILLPTAMPDGLECLYDEDGNGLDDSMEAAIAQCVAPEFRFDVGEPWWSLGPEEPHVLFNTYMDGIDGEDVHIVIRYSVGWAYDGGFATSGGACHDTNEHAGDSQGLGAAAWIRHGETGWRVEFERILVDSQGETIWYYPNAEPSIEMSADGHPVVYPSTGKHHWYVHGAEYDYDFWCGENAYGNMPPRVPLVEHVPNNIETLPQAALQCGDAWCDFWCNACKLRQSPECSPTNRSLREIDLWDWRFPDCYFSEDGCDDQNSDPGEWFFIAYPGMPHITDPYFVSPDVTALWDSVKGGFADDVDGDGLPFWSDPCPVQGSNGVDEDGDGLGSACDPDPGEANVYVAGGTPEYPALAAGPMAGFLDHPPACDADGPTLAQCAGQTTAVILNGAGSSDPDTGDVLTYSWVSGCPGGTFNDPAGVAPVLTVDTSGTCAQGCNVSLTVTDSGGLSSNCGTAVNIRDSWGPEIVCPANVTILCDSPADPSHTGVATATDVCDPGPLSIQFADEVPADACAGSTTITRTWTAWDVCGNGSDCSQAVTLVDPVPPVIACNSPASITPGEAPVSFAATATDNCDGAPRVEITSYSCSASTNNKMKPVDKMKSCKIRINGGTITIIDSGGVDDHISWTARATDCSGNVSTTQCALDVVHP